MNILIITQYFWPENFRINDLALGLIAKGHQVTVLTGMPNYPDGRFFSGYGIFKKRVEDYYGVKVLRVPLVPRGKSKGWQLAFNFFSFAFMASLLASFYCRGTFDVIFVFEVSPVTVGIPAIVLKKFKKIPIVFWVLDLWPESLLSAGGIKSVWILRWVGGLVNFIYRQCDRILVSSQAFIPSIKAMGGEPGRIGYFPNWAEMLYEPIQISREADKYVGLPSGFRVMFAGNIGTAQDFGTILEAAENLKGYPSIQWLILGDGRMFEWVKEQVRQRGLSNNVHLLGYHPLETMTHFFASADVMLVTLKHDPIFSLTVPGKIQSYLACGKPIVAAIDGEGGRLVKESGAGLASPAGNGEALAKAVLAMYHMPKAERENMGKRGRDYYESNFERNMLIHRLEGWMQELSKKENITKCLRTKRCL
jgi:glycosyltransferase involved in cell wall biosynthesis